MSYHCGRRMDHYSQGPTSAAFHEVLPFVEAIITELKIRRQSLVMVLIRKHIKVSVVTGVSKGN